MKIELKTIELYFIAYTIFFTGLLTLLILYLPTIFVISATGLQIYCSLKEKLPIDYYNNIHQPQETEKAGYIYSWRQDYCN